MISRRLFVLSSLGIALLGDSVHAALARKPKPAPELPRGGPRTLARQEWPPAIAPEYVGIVDKGYACFGDDMGRIVVVDLKREDTPVVIGEITGVGRKILGLAFSQYRCYAVVQVEAGADMQFQLVTISLTPASDLSILSRLVLENFSEPSCITAGLDMIAVGGTGIGGESQIAIFNAPRRKAVDPTPAGVLSLSQLPLHMDLQDRTLLALCGADRTDLTAINLANPRLPEKIKAIDLQGSFSALARFKDSALVAGSGADKRSYARLISMRPEPNVVKSVTLPSVTEILDIAAQRGQFLILGNQGDRQCVMPLIVGRKNDLSTTNSVMLPAGNRGADPRAHIAVKDRDAYVASDWGGVQVLNVRKSGWEFTYSHTIPRLPASAVVVEGSRAVLASADLKLYDLSDLRHPVLLNTTDTGGPVRSMLGIGRSILCLNKDGISLRVVEKPSSILVMARITGTTMAYDRSSGRVFVIAPGETTTAVTSLRVSEDSIKAEGTQEYPFKARKAAAGGGRLMLAGLTEVALFIPEDPPKLIGKRAMPNLAVRDMILTAEHAVVSCVDETLRGFLLLLSTSKDDLALAGSTDLPVDGAALAMGSNRVAVVVGRGSKGKDQAALVGLLNPAQPRVLESFDVVDAASAVTIRDQTAIIVGRGIEILNLG